MDPINKNQLSEFLQNSIPQEEWERIVTLKKIQNHWSEIVGEILAKETEPKNIIGSKLIIQTSHSIYSQEIHFMSSQILQRMKKIYGIQSIESLQCTLGKIIPPKKPPAYRKPKTLEGKEELVQFVEKVEDENVKKKLLELIEVLDAPKIHENPSKNTR